MSRLIDQYLTCELAAKELDICVEVLQRLCRRRQISYIRHGKRYLFTREDLDGYLKAQRVEPVAKASNISLKHLRRGE